jgi:cobalt-zinc-cadmium efflux system outer membrane protein
LERAQEPHSATRAAEATATTSPNDVAGNASVQPVAHQEVDQPAPGEHPARNGNKELREQENEIESPQPRQKITLPMAIELCVNNNFRVLAGAERIRMAEADLITSSLIPNPSLFADCQLIPLRHTEIQNQLGPPQWDTLVAFPIDWLLFGKRLAAMRAERLGIEVSNAEFSNVLRVQLAQTVDAFYEVLQDDAYFKLALKNLAELTELEKLTEELAKNKKVGDLEVDRIKLAVHEALLERHDRELALEVADLLVLR